MTPTPTITVIQAFQTPDGLTFETEELAREHMFQQLFKNRAEAYITARGLEKAKASRAFMTVTDFLTWEAMTEETPTQTEPMVP